MSNQTFFIFFSLILIVLVVELLRRSVLREKYAAFWAIIALSFLVFAIFPQAPSKISNSLGFVTTSNFVFSLVIFMMLILLMQITLEVGKLEDKIQTLAEESALSREEHERESK